LCQTGIVYDRRANGKVLSFGHAGILYRNSFVMYDRGSESLWVHVTGRAEAGPRKGWQLKFMPSSMTTWAAWKAAHPDTTVLPGHRRGGFMGTYKGITSPKGIGLVVRVAFHAKLYPFHELEKQPVVNDRFRDVDVVIAYSRVLGTASAWDRNVAGQTLTFEPLTGDAQQPLLLVRDAETGSVWSGIRGEAVSGQLKGQRLELVPHHPILTSRFPGFYPDAPVMGQ
jgi:hypothetical protein